MSEIRELQEYALEILLAVDQFCNENQIKICRAIKQ